ncbi:hypothetical protein MMC18_006699 [Xylographa bjoerkii]|nr:hypothetical protein [Xylographa bjoerkii]
MMPLRTKVLLHLYWRNTMATLLTTATDNDRSFAEEPPETPAPLFAVRAFKSALFGTPALEKDKEDDELQLPIVQHVSTEIIDLPHSPARSPAVSDNNIVAQQSKMDLLLSPAKGILLTPGTGATRRKTVSFGALADFNKGLTKSGPNQEGKGSTDLTAVSSSESGLTSQGNRRRETGLRRTLFDVQGKTSEFKLREGGLLPEDQTITDPTYKADDLAGKALTDSSDITVDLKHPLSRSGQHWKNEYQRDHENSKKEMRKLIHHAQAAKSYAIKRDAEALNLSEKLKQALARSAEMETRVSQLASQLSQSAGQQSKNPSNQAELLSELANQTANSLRYKQKAEKYKMAIQAHSTFAAGCKEIVQSAKDNSASEAAQASVQQARTDVDKLESVSALGCEEMLQLRNIAEMAENKAAALAKENLALKKTLARVKQEMKAYEIRHQAREQRRKRKDEKDEAQRLILQEELAKYRIINQQKTDNLPSQDPMGEIDGSRTTPSRVRTLKQHIVVDNLSERFHQSALPQQDENSPNLFPKILEKRKHGPTTESNSITGPGNRQDMKSSSLQEIVDIWAASVEVLKSTSPRDPSLVCDESPLAELKHFLNDGHSHRARKELATAEKSGKKIVDSKPLRQAGKCAVPARIVPNMDPAPAPAPVLPPDFEEVNPQDQSITEAASKPSEAKYQIRPHGPVPSQSRSNTLSRLLGNSRASSLSGRPPLPPDRVEAAKKRLEQRNAEVMRRNGSGNEQLQSSQVNN